MSKESKFWYLNKEEQNNLRRSVVNYLLYSPVLYRNHSVIPIEEVNRIDRGKLAEAVYREHRDLAALRELCERHEIKQDELLDDISNYIDLKLPSVWQRKKAYLEKGEQAKYSGIENVPGAVFQTQENYLFDKLIVQATKLKRKSIEQANNGN